MLKTFFAAAALLAAPLAEAATIPVTISNYTFMPATVKVHAGDIVTWTNQDSIPHTATALDGKSFNSSTIVPNGSWSFTFKSPGIYKYRCSIHPDMQGEIDVQ